MTTDDQITGWAVDALKDPDVLERLLETGVEKAIANWIVLERARGSSRNDAAIALTLMLARIGKAAIAQSGLEPGEAKDLIELSIELFRALANPHPLTAQINLKGD